MIRRIDEMIEKYEDSRVFILSKCENEKLKNSLMEIFNNYLSDLEELKKLAEKKK